VIRLEIDINCDAKEDGSRDLDCEMRIVQDLTSLRRSAKVEEEVALNIRRVVTKFLNDITNGSEAANG
jgi:hypothetical protein